MPTRLIIVRHGESAWNAEGRLQGQADPELSARGREQATRLRSAVSGLRPEGVVSSDLVRARETAALLGFPDAPTDVRWREIALGEWTAKLNSEVPLAELEAWRSGGHLPPGGETWDELARRVADAVEDLARRGGTRLVVSHGGCVRAAAAYVAGTGVEAFAGPANASITVLELAPRRRVLAFNRADEDGLPRPSDPGGTLGTVA